MFPAAVGFSLRSTTLNCNFFFPFLFLPQRIFICAQKLRRIAIELFISPIRFRIAAAAAAHPPLSYKTLYIVFPPPKKEEKCIVRYYGTHAHK